MAPLPTPPHQFPGFNTTFLSAGAELVRLHDPRFDGAVCNPCLGGPTRFAPLQTASGDCQPTLYAAESFECAVHESLFHDLPCDAPSKFIPISKVISRTVSWLEVRAGLRLASLHEPDLNRLGLARAQLIDTPPTRYPQTARWAQAFHRARHDIAGLVWTSRRCDPARAFVLFGDRLPTGALAVRGRVDIGASAVHLAEIRRFGRRAGVTITL